MRWNSWREWFYSGVCLRDEQQTKKRRFGDTLAQGSRDVRTLEGPRREGKVSLTGDQQMPIRLHLSLLWLPLSLLVTSGASANYVIGYMCQRTRK